MVFLPSRCSNISFLPPVDISRGCDYNCSFGSHCTSPPGRPILGACVQLLCIYICFFNILLEYIFESKFGATSASSAFRQFGVLHLLRKFIVIHTNTHDVTYHSYFEHSQTGSCSGSRFKCLVCTKQNV